MTEVVPILRLALVEGAEVKVGHGGLLLPSLLSC